MMLWAFIAVGDGRLLRLPAATAWAARSRSSSRSASSASPARYGVAWFGIRVNTFANRRTAFAALRGKPYPTYAIPLQGGHVASAWCSSALELLMMLVILLFVPRELAGPCFIGFAIGESLGAAALRIAGGIFTKIADIGSDLMKIVFKIKEDDARNPGVIADCTGDNAGDSVGPSRRRLRDLRRDGRGAHHVHPAGGARPGRSRCTLLVWIFTMRVVDGRRVGRCPTWSTTRRSRRKYRNATRMNFETPLTSLVWLTSVVSHRRDVRDDLPDPGPGRRRALLVELRDDRHLRHARRAPMIPESSRRSPRPRAATCARSS